MFGNVLGRMIETLKILDRNFAEKSNEECLPSLHTNLLNAATSLVAKLQEVEQKGKELEGERDRLAQDKAAANEVNAKLEVENQGLKEELAAEKAAKATLEGELVAERAAKDELAREKSVLTEAKAEVEREKGVLQRDFDAANRAKDTLKQEDNPLKIPMYSKLFSHISSHKGKYLIATTCIALAAAEYKEGVVTKLFEVCKEWIAANAPTKFVEMLGLSKQGEQIANVEGLNA